MDRPNREVSWLETFPADIWAHIICNIPGEQVGRLMMTGATLLWQRFKSPKVVKSINLGQDYIVFKSWPAFLNDFPSLEELCIHSSHDSWSQKLGLTYDSVPSGVRKLEFRGKWKVFKEKTASLNFIERLPQLETLDVSDLAFSSYSWMTHSPQSLTKLVLNCWRGTMQLPPSLIHFEATTVTLSKKSFVSKLPLSLECFVVNQLIGVDLILPLLPPSTYQLYLGYLPEPSRDGPESTHNLLEELPKSLTWFRVPISTGVNFETNPELTSLLPSTLTDLEIYPVFPSSAWPLLPQQLTQLVIRCPGSLCTSVSKIIDDTGVQIKSIPFGILPRSIKKLELIESNVEQILCGPPSGSFQAYFPPYLTHLKVSQVQLSPETAKLLPSSLTFLEIGNLCERVCEYLPTGLRTLTSYKTMMSPNLIKFFPKSLTFLHLCIYTGKGHYYDDKTGERIDFEAHPAYSIHKNCVTNDFNWQDCSHLPPTLTYFNLPNGDGLGDSILLHQQLPSLLELNLGASKHFTDLAIPTLCPHLTTLNLGSSNNISGKSFQWLPKCLTFLNLNSSESIFDSDIQHLPRSLREAHLNHAKHLTDLCVHDLPPQLGLLNMENNPLITPSSFPNFPYPLRSSQNPHSAKFLEWSITFGEIQTSAKAPKPKRR